LKQAIAASSKGENLARVDALGVWKGIKYKNVPIGRSSSGVGGPKGVDQLLDVVPGDGLNQSVEATHVRFSDCYASERGS
jgi:NADPH:quinone reductase-like Zn-dependent oxidoreductase